MAHTDSSDSLPSDDPPAAPLGGPETGETPIDKLETEYAQTIRVPTARGSTGAGKWKPPEVESLARLLPQYRIEKLLGRGGMAAVYKGLQVELDRPVAIKLLPSELASDEDFIDRFRREARVLAKLQHPGIVAIYDFGLTSEGHLYFVMEYVDGTDLGYIVRGPGLNSGQTLELICQICDALNYAHRQGVIHRDIKPSNILVSRDGRAKLADFGLARPLHDEVAGLTGTHVMMGTLDYMAPEQRDGAADHRADIYALGVMLYEMLTGKPPRGAFEPASHKTRVDVRIDDVVRKALQAEPDQRYQEVSELRTAVDRIRSGPPAPVAAAIPVSKPRLGKALAISALILLPVLGLGAFFASGNGKWPFPFKFAASHPESKSTAEDANSKLNKNDEAAAAGNSSTTSPNPQNKFISPDEKMGLPAIPSKPVATSAPLSPEPDLASLEKERAASELKARQEEEETKRRQQQEKQKQEAMRQKMEEERQIKVKIDADVEALRKAEALEASPLLASAAGGDSAAQSVLALWQREGYKMRKDPAAAMRWAALASGQGNPVGQAALAILNWGDDGLKADRDQAANLAAQAMPGLKTLSARNEPAACYALGRIYSLGIGTPRDPTAAADLYRPASLQGFALAKSALGSMYERGEGVPKDPAAARSLLDEAATAYLLKRESVSTPGGIIGLDPGTPVVIVSQKNGVAAVKTRLYQLEVAESALTWDSKAAQTMLQESLAAQRAFKEKANAELLAQKQQQALAAEKVLQLKAAYAATPVPARPLSPAEQLAALHEQEMKIGLQLSDASAQLSQIRVVGNVRTSPNAAAAMNARKEISDQMTGLNAQLRDIRNQEAILKASMNAAAAGAGSRPGPVLRGATLQPTRGGL